MVSLKDYGFESRFCDAHMSKLDLPDWVAKQVLLWEKKPFKEKGIFTLLGNPGIGKTYLCAALTNNFLEKGERWIRYYRESKFYAAVKSVWPEGWDTYREIERICEADYFMLDDMLAPFSDNPRNDVTDYRLEVIMDAINIRYESQKPTVLTSNLLEKEIHEKFPDSFLSRLKDVSGVFIECEWKDKRQQAYE